MSGIGGLTGWDRRDLSYAIEIALDVFITRYDDIGRVAERFCCNDRSEAFADILKKGLQEYLDMCDLDDRLEGQ